MIRISESPRKVLGRGGYATVYEGTYGGKAVAVKRVLLERVEGAAAGQEEPRGEQALKNLDHPNVVKLLHAESNAEFRLYALELCASSLDKLFTDGYSGPKPTPEDMILQLATGLEYVHEKRLVHRDLKPENALIWVAPKKDTKKHDEVEILMKWADFGLCKQVNERGSYSASGIKGTLNWCAPEVLEMMEKGDGSTLERRMTLQSDVFAEGLTFGYILLGGKHPYGDNPRLITNNLIQNDAVNLKKIPKKYEKLTEIVTEMLKKEPDERPTAKQVAERLVSSIDDSPNANIQANIDVQEKVTWITLDSVPLPYSSGSELKRDWLKMGEKKLTIDDETHFCHLQLLLQLLYSKSALDKLDLEKLGNARRRSYPFEKVGKAFFQDRSALKMANLDEVFDFVFTDPKNENGTSFVAPNELLYFADICGGPGAFAEYFLWRKKWNAKGFGFTLKNPKDGEGDDYKLGKIIEGPCECFEPHYGVNGIDGDGDIYNSKNIREFKHFVFSRTEEKGVHFMMADGTISMLRGQENIQEILSKRMYLCQFLMALAVVRPGGHFVCTVFDLFTPFSAGLLFLMCFSFKRVCIHKPNASRPANSERFIICKWKKSDTKDIENYLFEINNRFEQLSHSRSKMDIIEIVPITLMKANTNFCSYLSNSNNKICERQVGSLEELVKFYQNPSHRKDGYQTKIKNEALKRWKIPIKRRISDSWNDSAAFFRREINDDYEDYDIRMINENVNDVLSHKVKSIDDNSACHQTLLEPICDWRCIVLGLESNNPMQTFFLGFGGKKVYRWDATKNKWTNKLMEKVPVELVRDTLIYGELIEEVQREEESEMRSFSLHIIDAIYLGGVDVSECQMEERYTKIRQYCTALSKTSRTDLIPLRAKELFKLDAQQLFDGLSSKKILKNRCYVDGDNPTTYYFASGLLINRRNVHFFECHENRIFDEK